VRLEAVLFDWGHTLMDFVWDDSFIAEGHRAGLEAIGRDDLPDLDRLGAHFREHYEPLFWVPGTIEELEYPGLVRRLLGDFDVEVSDDELNRFLEAEHAAWGQARQLGAHTHALLDALHDRGLKTGLVSNAFDPGWLLRNDLDRMGLADRLDVAVFSSEVGKRKPHPSIFEAALGGLEVQPEEALFVGDSLYHDVGGASALGMTTMQALWFRADDDERGIEPDYQAFTPMDVLNVVRRLRDEA
jgi:putative hydrolase of the HAD superfamily